MLAPMRIVFATCLLVAALAARLAGQDPAPPPGPKVSFVFRWPVPSTATVTETTLKGGRTGVTRYRLELVAGRKPDERLLRLRDYEFVKLEGLDLADPAVQRRLGPLQALAQAIPDLAVGSDGSFHGIVDVDTMIERCLDFLRKQPERDPRAVDAVAASMRDANAKELMSQAGAAFWNCWAGNWAGRELAPGGSLTAVAASVLPGSQGSGMATIRHHGPAADTPGCVRLSMEMTATGAEVAHAMLEALAPQLLAQNDTSARLKDMKLFLSAEAVLDPITLQPRKASYERKVEVVPPGEKLPQTQVERRSYEFTWK
jgi:hypothetical protein